MIYWFSTTCMLLNALQSPKSQKSSSGDSSNASWKTAKVNRGSSSEDLNADSIQYNFVEALKLLVIGIFSRLLQRIYNRISTSLIHAVLEQPSSAFNESSTVMSYATSDTIIPILDEYLDLFIERESYTAEHDTPIF